MSCSRSWSTSAMTVLVSEALGRSEEQSVTQRRHCDESARRVYAGCAQSVRSVYSCAHVATARGSCQAGGGGPVLGRAGRQGCAWAVLAVTTPGLLLTDSLSLLLARDARGSRPTLERLGRPPTRRGRAASWAEGAAPPSQASRRGGPEHWRHGKGRAGRDAATGYPPRGPT